MLKKMNCDKELNLLSKYKHIYYEYNVCKDFKIEQFKYVYDYMLLWKLAYINYLKANFEGG